MLNDSLGLIRPHKIIDILVEKNTNEIAMQVLMRHDVTDKLLPEILSQIDEFQKYMTNSRVVFTKLKRHDMWLNFISSYENSILNHVSTREEYERQLCAFVVQLEKDDKF
jgi:predicted nucleotidyltransferase